MKTPIKAILFDYMGTCVDWHSGIVQALPAVLSDEDKSDFALEVRQAYFDENADRIRKGLEVENFDDTQRRVLDACLEGKEPHIKQAFSPSVREQFVSAWHHQRAWADVPGALQKLKHERGWETYVHANGSTRLQLDITKSAGLQFDLLLSSELLGLYKPAPESYLKALKVLQLRPEECVMVAAHAYDLRGARAVGIKTVYVHRWTDDIREEQEVVKGENDAYLSDMSKLDEVIAALE